MSAAETSAGAPAAQSASEPEVIALGTAFRRVSRALARLRGRDTHLGCEQISHAQFELLSELEQRGPLPAGELASAAGLSPATVTQMLDQLAGAGHVVRIRSLADRRVVVSQLTAQGQAKLAAKRSAWQLRWRQALAGLEPQELVAAACVLERLATMIEDPPG